MGRTRFEWEMDEHRHEIEGAADRLLKEIQEERKRSNIPPPTPEERAETIGRINARDGVIDPEE